MNPRSAEEYSLSDFQIIFSTNKLVMLVRLNKIAWVINRADITISNNNKLFLRYS